MNVTVVDASAVAAVVFDEPEAAPVMASLQQAIIAPSLIRYEMASVCAVKLMRGPRQAKATLDRYRLFNGLEIEFAEPDWDTLPVLARQWELTAYDAAYLQLALARHAPLVTLDARLAAAYDKAAGLPSRR
ncbi:MAG TPA: type II toxin-antitoxin system VapC family toxin [Burkholderiales bacterium]|jgi:predicted nucleic acid-binding protein|nr:type II toxin-antitoxin system VapC family toxin [Burkholderiales bacterium]